MRNIVLLLIVCAASFNFSFAAESATTQVPSLVNTKKTSSATPLVNTEKKSDCVFVTSIYLPENATIYKLNIMNYVLQRNLEAFAEVHLLTQTDTSYETYASSIPILADFRAKVTISYLPKDYQANQFQENFNSTAYLYSDILQYVNTHLSGRLVVISNNDIEFPQDAPLKLEAYVSDKKKGAVITRKEAPCANVNAPPLHRCENKQNSYDVFAFKSPVPAEAVEASSDCLASSLSPK